MHLAALARRMPMPRPSLLLTRQALAGFATGVATVVAYAALQRVMRRLAALASQASAQPEEQTGAEDDPSSDGGNGEAGASPLRKQLSRRFSWAAKVAMTRLSRSNSASEDRMTYVERRYFSPARGTAELCRANGSDVRPWQETRQRWLLAIDGGEAPHPKVHNRLWVTYRMWVDAHIAGREGRPDIFHNFCIARALGIPIPCAQGTGMRWWTGSEAGDLISCLAAEGVLVRGCQSGKDALEDFLASSLEAYNNRFTLAHNRTVEGFTRDEQKEWEGVYHFVQIADPQIGMFKMDADWAEEVREMPWL